MSGLFDSGSLRFQIFALLRDSEAPLTAAEIAARLGAKQSAVSSCLRLDLGPTGRAKEDNLYRWSLLPSDQAGSAEAAELDDPLALARQQIETLQKRLADTQWQLEQAHRALDRFRTPEGVKALYTKVGLAPECEDHVFRAARRSYRRKHHPDRVPEAEKKEAHLRFVEIDGVFEKLKQHRAKK